MAQYYPSDYLTALQSRLKALLGANFPVYNLFNRNNSLEPVFITHTIRDVGTPIFTGANKEVHGIDQPIIQLSIFSADALAGHQVYQTLTDFFHGYLGPLSADPSVNLAAKCSMHLLYISYNDETSRHQIVVELTLDVITPK